MGAKLGALRRGKPPIADPRLLHVASSAVGWACVWCVVLACVSVQMYATIGPSAGRTLSCACAGTAGQSNA